MNPRAERVLLNRVERLEAALDAAQDVGVYPKSVIHSDGTEHFRTTWEEGWNAALKEVNAKILEALRTKLEQQNNHE